MVSFLLLKAAIVNFEVRTFIRQNLSFILFTLNEDHDEALIKDLEIEIRAGQPDQGGRDLSRHSSGQLQQKCPRLSKMTR